MKIQICGKVTGERDEENWRKMEAAEKMLFAAGAGVVINPRRIVKDWDTPWERAMDICRMSIIEDANALWMLEDWQQSRGARDEHRLAKKLGRRIFYHTDIELVREAAKVKWEDTSDLEFP